MNAEPSAKQRQANRLLDYLRHNPTITSLEGWTSLGIYRMSGVVYALRKRGFAIKTSLVVVSNRWGETCRVAQYTLATPPASPT